MRLKDKVAVVTGAASGFGRGIAELFAAEGARVVIADINGEAAAALAAEIGPDRAIATAIDVTKRADVDAMIAAAVDRFGGVDILVNNAGVTHKNQSLLTVSEDEFDRIYAVNVKSIYLTTLAVVPVMEKRGGGSIITTASTAGIRPRPGLTWYNGSKGAAITLTKSMAENRAKFVAGIPLGRMSKPLDIANAALFLADPASAFITGVAIEVDGGRCI